MSSENPEASVGTLPSLERLAAASHGDELLFAVALHSYAEHALRLLSGDYDLSFYDLVARRIEASGSSPDSARLYRLFRREHRLIEEARRDFRVLNREERRSFLWTFLRLGENLGWSALDGARDLKGLLSVWETRDLPVEDLDSPDEVPLSRLVHLARNRRGFQNIHFAFTEEQNRAVANFRDGEDRLITGGPGTGKTLVLLESLGRSLRSGPASLITFTKALVNYDRYLALGKGMRLGASILPSEDFFTSKLIIKEPRHRVDYKVLLDWIPQVNTGVLSDGELYVEIEEFLFGLNITKEEYLESRVPRKGLKTSLGLAEREEVWSLREALARRMIQEGRYSQRFARLRLVEWLEHDPEGLKDDRALFVDESQDMAAVELLCLKGLSGRGLVMASDSGQSIYGFINPYRRARLGLAQEQIDVLRTNHRNTIQIQNASTAYRLQGAGAEETPGTENHPYRTGPPMTWHEAETQDHLADLLVESAFRAIDDLEYLPGELGILCSRSAHLNLIARKLQVRGLPSAVMKDQDFDFADSSKIRLSTLHSSKGLSFPVVLIFLPEMPPAREIDGAYQQRLWRHVVSVGMSRAMDWLSGFRLYST